MDLDPKEKNIDKKDQMQKERRSFLKKAAYSAPALIVMGQLARPTSAHAESCLPGTPVNECSETQSGF